MIPKHPNTTFRSPSSRLAALALFCGASCLAGCASVSPQHIAERKITGALPRILGPAQSYDVHVTGDAFALSRGRAKRVQIAGTQVQLTPSLTMDSLNLDASDLSFDTQSKTLQNIGGLGFQASLGQASLNRHLAQTKGADSGLQVTLRENDMEASVPVSVLGLRTTARLSGGLSPHPGAASKLDFHADGAHLGVVPLPAALLNVALDRLNPVLDLSEVKIPLSVTSATVEHGMLKVTGTAEASHLTSGSR
ncbi:hypothetical protein CCAX7_58590 [Capsulimonas corticalis]|uniref:Uncharacterized protein n=1 Tax=Capsulimonas corticalis TaxID=2219043 RepID=A0A402CZY2_9BACT|nr:DUF2993 domain-containing protein [Capsulimonas corticalis]BDI33808.1 hypothetical protein CCAX7_58590 [Capsulimonas corticalis]